MGTERGGEGRGGGKERSRWICVPLGGAPCGDEGIVLVLEV